TGGLLSVLHLTLIPLMLLGGLLLDRLGIRFMILAGCFFTGAALYTFTASYEYRWTIAAVALLGAGAACLSPATIVLMPDAFFGKDHVGASLNLGNVFFALGALITPTLVEVLLLGLGFRRAVISLGLLALVPALIVLFVSPD